MKIATPQLRKPNHILRATGISLLGKTNLRLHTASLFCLFLAPASFTALAQGWDKEKSLAPSVIVTPGTPHAWTMEQAHYLLERNRAHDLGIAEQDPGALNPNDTVGFRIESLRTLLSASVKFDQTVALKNRQTLEQYDQQLAAYNAGLAKQQAVTLRQTALAFQLAQAQSDLSVLNAATTPDKDKIAAKQAEVTRLQADTAALNTEQSSLAAATPKLPDPPTLTAVTPDDAAGTNSALGSDPNFDTLLKSFAQGPNSSKLSAKAMLDNYVDFQYEMVAKQLTLLRDQAGPDNRVLFLELPHSIYVTQKFHPYPYLGGLWGDHLVQAWWKVDGGLMATPLCAAAVENGVHRAPTLREIQTLARGPEPATVTVCEKASEEQKHNQEAFKAFFPDYIPGTTPAAKIDFKKETTEAFSNANKRILDFRATVEALDRSRTAAADQAKSGGHEQKPEPVLDRYAVWANAWGFDYALNETGAPGSPTAPIHTLDLIPRQDSLNVAEASATSHQYGFAGVFSWLAGIGAKARYERQQQQASQFTQTEQYATAFGKGDYKFGWTFAPKPGTKQVDAGTRTTYVVLVVPRDTRVVRLNSVGCGYRRRNVPRDPFSSEAINLPESKSLRENYLDHKGDDLQHLHKLDDEDCGGVRTFDVEVPDSDDNFWIASAKYSPVLAGQRSTLTLTGRLGDQVGILINGTPLQKVPSLTQPGLTPSGYTVPPNAGDTGISGVFEIVHNRSSDEDMSSNLVASFTTPAGFVGTPVVTVVSSARELVLGAKEPYGPPPNPNDGSDHDMFYTQPAIVRIDALYPDPDHVALTIVGHGFDTSPKTTLLIGPTGYNGAPGAPHPYTMPVDSAVLNVTVPRKDLFPHTSIDFISMYSRQPFDATFARDDDGPPKLTECSGKADKPKNTKKHVAFTLKGDYFVAGSAPKPSIGDDIVTVFKDSKEWDFAATLPQTAKEITVSIVQGKSVPMTQACAIK